MAHVRRAGGLVLFRSSRACSVLHLCSAAAVCLGVLASLCLQESNVKQKRKPCNLANYFKKKCFEEMDLKNFEARGMGFFSGEKTRLPLRLSHPEGPGRAQAAARGTL